MEFKVISFDSNTGQIVVEVANMRLALDLPIDDAGYVPEGDELEKYVMGFVPIEALRRQRILSQHGGVRNAGAIQSLVVEQAPDQAFDIRENYLNDLKLSVL